VELVELRNRVFRELRTQHPKLLPEEIDDALNATQQVYIQPVARERAKATHTISSAEHQAKQLALGDVMIDLYELDFVKDETHGLPGTTVSVLSPSDAQHAGIRIIGDTLYLFGQSAGNVLAFYYFRKLKDLGTATEQVTVPEIDERWHDLYWLGAVVDLVAGHARTEQFFTRLAEFRAERQRAQYAGPRRTRPRVPWV